MCRCLLAKWTWSGYWKCEKLAVKLIFNWLLIASLTSFRFDFSVFHLKLPQPYYKTLNKHNIHIPVYKNVIILVSFSFYDIIIIIIMIHQQNCKITSHYTINKYRQKKKSHEYILRDNDKKWWQKKNYPHLFRAYTKYLSYISNNTTTISPSL